MVSGLTGQGQEGGLSRLCSYIFKVFGVFLEVVVVWAAWGVWDVRAV